MVSERIQRQIDRLLDDAEQSFIQRDWATLLDRAQDVLLLAPDSQDALAFQEAAQRALGSTSSNLSDQEAQPVVAELKTHPEVDQPALLRRWPLSGQTLSGRGRQEEGLSRTRRTA